MVYVQYFFQGIIFLIFLRVIAQGDKMLYLSTVHHGLPLLIIFRPIVVRRSSDSKHIGWQLKKSRGRYCRQSQFRNYKALLIANAIFQLQLKTLLNFNDFYVFLLLQLTAVIYSSLILKSFAQSNYCNCFFKLMKQHHLSSNENTIVIAQPQESSQGQAQLHEPLVRSQQLDELTFFRSEGKKLKKIVKKPQTMLQKLILEIPLSFNHVFNFLNILSINEHTLKDLQHEQSYFKSIFYIKNVQKVELRKNAIILFTKNIQSTLTPVQYLIERFRSYGDNAFYQLANSIELSHRLYMMTDYSSDLLKSYDGEPLSRFIQAMQQRIYACKVAPNKIVLSRRLLELLGEDMELYGLKLCKYKTPLREISSNESYFSVVKKSIDNIGIISEFLRKKMSFEQLQTKTYMEFKDYLYTQQQKKIYCKFKLYMPTSLINCVEIMEQYNQSQDCDRYWKMDPIKRRGLDRECNQQRYIQAETLRYLIELSDSMLVNNRKKLAGYCLKP